jgi:hypothetical protein
MPSGYLQFKEVPPIRGMNTIDDPKSLKPGECVELVNAFPGSPPIPRRGCKGVLLDGYGDLIFFAPAIAMNVDESTFIFVWGYDDITDSYTLLKIDIDGGGAVVVAGYATFNTPPVFSAENAFGCAYLAAGESMVAWKNASFALGAKVIESDGATVRDMCISDAAEVLSVVAVGDNSAGVFSNGDCFDYSFTFVRRDDSSAWKEGATPSSIILPHSVTEAFDDPEPQRVDTYLPGVVEGVELYENRKSISISGAFTKYNVKITIKSIYLAAVAQGATHLRVCRTRRQESVENAKGATRFSLAYLPLHVSTTEFIDSTSDAAMALETNQFTMAGYTVMPDVNIIKFHAGRMFALDRTGKAYYSEVPGGDGSDLELALQYPQKYASMFKPFSYFLDMDSEDTFESTGMASLGNDLYFFKERKIYALFGGDPSAAARTCINENIGCAFPNTITECEIKGSFGNCILFLSNEGPYCILEGGRVVPFSLFKIKELWPDKSDELFGELRTAKEWIMNNCSAMFYKNFWLVTYRTTQDVFRYFGYYFDRSLANDSGAPQGPFMIELGEISEGV